MSLRYVAILVRAGSAPENDIARLTTVFGSPPIISADGTIVFANDAKHITISDFGRCICLGRIFTTGDRPAPVKGFDDDDLRKLSDAGEYFYKRYWGGYVAIVRKHLDSIEVVRDPSGGMPCYLIERDSLLIVASDVGVLVDAKILKPSVNFREAARQFQHVGLRGAATAIEGLNEIRAGFSLVAGGSHYRSIEQRWKPWQYCSPMIARSDQELQEQLRSTISACVNALASEFQHVLLTLSGGLDSSIVAACLAKNHQAVTCLTLTSPGSEGDERAEAASVAQHLGLRLIVDRLRVEDFDLQQSSAAHLPRPVGSPLRRAFDEACLRAGHAVGAIAHFNGNGGDNVFAFSRSTAAVLDQIAVGASYSEIWKTVLNISRLSKESAYKVLMHAARARLKRNATTKQHGQTRFLNPEVIEDHDECGNEWLAAPKKLLPGQTAHISKLLTPQNYIEGFGRGDAAELVTPLLAQPVMELCLSVPSWLWCAGGLDRAQARAAFSDALPPPTVARTAKGGPTGFFYAVLESSRSEIREHLLDGCLMSAGLLDRNAIELFFQGEPLTTPADDAIRILELADSESWARGWRNRLV